MLMTFPYIFAMKNTSKYYRATTVHHLGRMERSREYPQPFHSCCASKQRKEEECLAVPGLVTRDEALEASANVAFTSGNFKVAVDDTKHVSCRKHILIDI
jgi:hypothetical protein